MTPATKLNWKTIDNFSKDEFPEGVLANLDAEFIRTLSKFRDNLGSELYPSPLPDGWVRTKGSKGSQHYAVGRLSTAGDVFLSESQDPRTAFTRACQYFKGVGIYYDTIYEGKPRIMLHIDTRDTATTWCRHKGNYIYPNKSKAEADTFYFLLNRGVPQP